MPMLSLRPIARRAPSLQPTRRACPHAGACLFGLLLAAASATAQSSTGAGGNSAGPRAAHPRDARVHVAPAPAERAGWTEVFQAPTLSLGRYRLAKGSADHQQPHARDEMYFVLSGEARFTADGETRTVRTGDSIFVAARVEHRFHDIEADLDLLVFFSSAVRPTGGMPMQPPPTGQTPYPETSQRGSTRIFYWYGPESAGQVALDYGQPRWQAAFARFVEQPRGTRWRFGENFWTTLDTNMALELGGVRVDVGLYYAVLESSAERGVELVLLDPQPVRERRLDAFEAGKTEGGIRIPLRLEKQTALEDRLALNLQTDPARRDHGSLTIGFGPYRLAADLRMHPHR